MSEVTQSAGEFGDTEYLKKRVAELKAENRALEEEVSDLEEKVDELQNEVHRLENEIEDVDQGELADNAKKLCDLVERHIGHIHCDESIDIHNIRMTCRDVRDAIL